MSVYTQKYFNMTACANAATRSVAAKGQGYIDGYDNVDVKVYEDALLQEFYDAYYLEGMRDSGR